MTSFRSEALNAANAAIDAKYLAEEKRLEAHTAYLKKLVMDQAEKGQLEFILNTQGIGEVEAVKLLTDMGIHAVKCPPTAAFTEDGRGVRCGIQISLLLEVP